MIPDKCALKYSIHEIQFSAEQRSLKLADLLTFNSAVMQLFF